MTVDGVYLGRLEGSAGGAVYGLDEGGLDGRDGLVEVVEGVAVLTVLLQTHIYGYYMEDRPLLFPMRAER